MNIGMVTPWKCRCGISDYSYQLSMALSEHLKVYIVRMQRFGRRNTEFMQFLPMRRIPETLEEGRYKPVIDLLHVQHEYGLFVEYEKPFFEQLSPLGLTVVTTMHATGNFKFDKIVAENSDEIIVHNQHCQDLLSRQGIHSKIIPHGCGPADPLPKDKAMKAMKQLLNFETERPIAGVFGFISEYKNYEDLIESILRTEGHLLIVGGWHFPGMKEEAKKAELLELTRRAAPGRVSFTGWIPDNLLPMIFGAVDVVVSNHRYASESGSLLKALSYGKPVLATAIRPFLAKEKEGALKTFDSKQTLIDNLKTLLENEDERKKLEEGARRYAENNSWAKVAQAHVELYESLL